MQPIRKGKTNGGGRFRLLVLVALVCLAMEPAIATAQSTRAEQLRERRREKAESLMAPDRPGLVEKAVLMVERRLTGFSAGGAGLRALSPVFGGLRSGSGTTVGVRYDPTRNRDHILFSASARASLRSYWGVKSVLGYDAGRVVSYVYAQYRHMPGEDYYGLGPKVTEEMRTTYLHDESIAGGLIGIRVLPDVFVGGQASFLTNRIGAGTDRDYPSIGLLYHGDEAPGLGHALDYLVASAYVEYDTRDVPYLPGYGSRYALTQQQLRGLSLDARRGFFFAAEFFNYLNAEHGYYDFSRADVELQEYIPLRNGYHVFALRQFAAMTYTGDDDQVPFYLMQTLGGSRSIRGFENFRFRDRNAVLFNGEYRYHVWHYLNIAFFLDAGQVFHTLDELALSEVEASYGVGFRFRSLERAFARIDVAKSREGIQTYVKIGSFF